MSVNENPVICQTEQFLSSLGCIQPETISIWMPVYKTRGRCWPRFQQSHEREHALTKQDTSKHHPKLNLKDRHFKEQLKCSCLQIHKCENTAPVHPLHLESILLMGIHSTANGDNQGCRNIKDDSDP